MNRLPEGLRILLSAGRAILGETEAGLRNPSWEEASARILIARLSPFQDVDRSTSHLILFAEVRRALPGAYIDFAFFPNRSDRGLLAREEKERNKRFPWFFGAVSGSSPEEFDLILVSNAFGLELVNVAYLFSPPVFPVRASERFRAKRRFPLVILGGSNAGQAGALVGEEGDSLVDGLFFGEGEGAIGPLVGILSEASRPADSRLEAAAARVEGFWPVLHPETKVRRRHLEDSPPPLLEWPLFNGPEAGTARLQISAGCPGLCSFCFEGWDRRPYRERPLADLLQDARALRRCSGASSLEVYSFNFNTHEEVVNLLFELGRIFRRVNFMSQRLDILAETEGLLAAELAADKRSFTLGIEGISRRMRAYYRKGLSEANLDRLLDLLLVPGVRELKLFYILSGRENADDIEEFGDFADRLAAGRAARARGLRILVSAGYLVRLPGTPLQYEALALDEEAFRGIRDSLRSICAEKNLEFRLAAHFDEYCVDQVLALRGPGPLPWLESTPAAKVLYDGSLSRGAWPSLKAFARDRSLLDAAFLGEKDSTWTFPLPFLETSVRDSPVLYEEFTAARREEDRKPCLGGECSGCGACKDREERERLTRHRTQVAGRREIERIAGLQAAKTAFHTLPVLLELPPALAGAAAEASSAWVLRELCRRVPGAEARVFEVEPRLPRPGAEFGLPEGATGKAIFLFKGPRAEAMAACAAAAGMGALPSLPEFRRLRLEMSFSGEEIPRLSFTSWLRERRLPFIEEAGAQGRLLRIPAEAQKRAILFGAELGDTTFVLDLGTKADIALWLARLDPLRAGLPRLRVLDFS